MWVGNVTCCFVSNYADISLNVVVVPRRMHMKIKITNSVTICVHGC